MKIVKIAISIASFLSPLLLFAAIDSANSGAVFTFDNIYTENNRIIYISDQDGNRVPDFSYAGYQNSSVSLPNVTEPIIEVSCALNDCTQNIQNAINEVSSYTPKADGFRGVVYLPAGTYNISSGLTIAASGVVLRGAGSEDTIINVTNGAGAAASVITAGNPAATAGWPNTTGQQANVDNAFIPVGATEFRVKAGGYVPEAGHEIVFVHPTTPAWIQKVNYGGVPAPGWSDETSLPDILYKRTVKNVVQNGATYSVAINEPLLNHIDKNVTAAYIYRFDAASENYVNKIGIENLKLAIGSNDGITPYIGSGVLFVKAQDVWAKDVTVSGYSANGFNASSVDRITIKNSKAIEPIGPYLGGVRYAFRSSSYVNNYLCDGCEADKARLSFVTNFFGSGNVYVRSKATNACGASEGHQKWTTGNLFDLMTLTNNTSLDPSCDKNAAGFFNRGTSGTNHGWSAAHSVMWGVKATGATDEIIIQKPPTAQNYCYNCSAFAVTGVAYSNFFQSSPGYFATNSSTLTSLFDAQLAERLAAGDNGPSAPANLKTTVSQGNVTLTWDNLAIGASANVIERSTDAGKTFRLLTSVAPTATSYVDRTNSSTNAPNYLYRVYARKMIGGVVARSATSNTSPLVARYVRIELKSPMTSTSTVRLNELEVLNASGNLARNKPVTASVGTTNKNALVDGGISSLRYWQSTLPQPGFSSANPIFAFVDLGAAYGIKQIKLYQSNNYYPTEYYLYVSPDAERWTQIVGNVTGTGGNVTFNF